MQIPMMLKLAMPMFHTTEKAHKTNEKSSGLWAGSVENETLRRFMRKAFLIVENNAAEIGEIEVMIVRNNLIVVQDAI